MQYYLLGVKIKNITFIFLIHGRYSDHLAVIFFLLQPSNPVYLAGIVPGGMRKLGLLKGACNFIP